MISSQIGSYRCAITLRSGASFGGTERRFARLFSFLAAEGHDIGLFCTQDALVCMRQLGIELPSARVHVIDHPSGATWIGRKWNRIRGIIVLFLQLRRAGIQHVHIAANPGPFTVLYSIGSRWLPTFSFSLVDSLPPALHERSKLQRWFIERSMRYAKRVDCLSTSIASSARRLAKSSCKGIVVVSPCSFTDLTHVETGKDRDIDFLFMARFTDGKGLEILAEAISILRTKGAGPYEIHVCGQGELKVSIPGVQIYHATNSFAVMSRARVFLSIQQYNNYPSQSLLEAMASCCAVIATDVGDTRQLLDQTCAELIPYDAGILAEAMILLAGDSSRRTLLAEAARTRLMESHSIERFAEYFLQELC